MGVLSVNAWWLGLAEEEDEVKKERNLKKKVGIY